MIETRGIERHAVLRASGRGGKYVSRVQQCHDLPKFITGRDFAAYLGVNISTIYRWRTEGKRVETRGLPEVIILQAITTSEVLIVVSHEERRGGVRCLGAVEFVAALAPDPTLRHMEKGLL